MISPERTGLHSLWRRKPFLQIFCCRQGSRRVCIVCVPYNSKRLRSDGLPESNFYGGASMHKTVFILCLAVAGFLASCSHDSSLRSTKEREMTLGIVQKEISTGMSQASVAEALGSPNIVTRDDDGMETWIYDKIATE